MLNHPVRTYIYLNFILRLIWVKVNSSNTALPKGKVAEAETIVRVSFSVLILLTKPSKVLSIN